MKITLIKVLTNVGTVLIVALTGWTTVSAAKMTGKYIASQLFTGATTDTPTATVTSTTTETPMLNGTHEPGDDVGDEYLTSVPAGTQYMEEESDDNFLVVPGITATPYAGEEDDENYKGEPSMSSTPNSNHKDNDEHNYNVGGGDDGGGDD